MHKGSDSRVHITPSFPFELHHIKALWLNHQYKECARRCENLLAHNQDEPAHVIFLNLYAALSHEGLARTMHVYSVWRLPKIAAAESAYNRAMDACLEEEHRIESSTLSMPGLAIDQPMSQPAASKQIHVRKRKDKPSLAHLGPGLERSHSNSSKRVERINFSWPRNFTPLSCATVKAIQYNVCRDMNTPLDDPFTISPSEPSSAATSAQDTPIKTTNLSAKNSKDSFDSPHPPSPTPSYRSVQLPAASRAYATYLTNLTAIRTQLTTHLHHLLDLKQSTITEQEERVRRQSGSVSDTKTATKLPQSRSFWSFKDEEAEKKEKMARVKEGRARGWKTVRFEPKRYVELAEDALSELEGV